METLVPPLLLAVREVRWMMSAGTSMKEAFRTYLEGAADEVASELRERWTLKWQSNSAPARPIVSPYVRAFWELIERGCAGQPVLEPLRALEDEIERAAAAELELHLTTLPFKTLIPLLALQFPAHMILLVGPMLRELNRHLGG